MIKLMEFLKKILSRRLNSPINNMVIHIISYTFLGFITYLFIRNFNIFDSLQIFIFSIISFAIFMYISDNFKLSKVNFIKFLQILVFIFTILGFIALILYLLDIYIFDSVFCEFSNINKNTILPVITTSNKMIKIITQIIMKTINRIKIILLNINPQYKSSFLFPFIIQNMGANINTETDDIIRYSFSMFTLSLIVLISFINIMGFLLSLYLINKYDIETKFPKFKKIIKYYENSNKIFIIFEVILSIVILLIMIIINLFLCGMIVLNK